MCVTYMFRVCTPHKVCHIKYATLCHGIPQYVSHSMYATVCVLLWWMLKCMFVYVCACAVVRMCLCMYVCTCQCMRVCVHPCACATWCMYMCACRANIIPPRAMILSSNVVKRLGCWISCLLTNILSRQKQINRCDHNNNLLCFASHGFLR